MEEKKRKQKGQNTFRTTLKNAELLKKKKEKELLIHKVTQFFKTISIFFMRYPSQSWVEPQEVCILKVVAALWWEIKSRIKETLCNGTQLFG